MQITSAALCFKKGRTRLRCLSISMLRETRRRGCITVAFLPCALYLFEIRFGHHGDEVFKTRFRLPAKNCSRFGAVTLKEIDFGGTVKFGVYPYDHFSRF